MENKEPPIIEHDEFEEDRIAGAKIFKQSAVVLTILLSFAGFMLWWKGEFHFESFAFGAIAFFLFTKVIEETCGDRLPAWWYRAAGYRGPNAKP